MAKVQGVAERYWRAEETRDVEAILAQYHPNAELIVPEMGRLVGHHEIRGFYEASIRRFPFLRVEVLSGFEHADDGAFEWRATFVDYEGRSVILQGVNVISTRDGVFQSVHVYYDPAPLGVSAVSELDDSQT